MLKHIALRAEIFSNAMKKKTDRFEWLLKQMRSMKCIILTYNSNTHVGMVMITNFRGRAITLPGNDKDVFMVSNTNE